MQSPLSTSTSSSTSVPEQISNRLINGLPEKPRRQLLLHCTPAQLVFGDNLADFGRPMEYVYFPLTAIISQFAGVSGRQPIDLRMIGNEGMLGATLALGINNPPLRSVVQSSGGALRMTASRFREQLQTSPIFQLTLNRYLYVLIEQLAQTAACNSFHKVPARLARWLLLTHDRAHGNSFHLTHRFLANMLGVRRSAVTIAAGEFQQRNLIRYVRGQISVLSRSGLENASCECYAASVNTYNRCLPVSRSQ